VSTRVSRARAVVATGRRPTTVAKVAGVSRQAPYRPISRRPAAAGPGRGRPGDERIVAVAQANPVDGTRMVAALASRQLGEPVNRKRVQRIMRSHKLLQPSRNTDRRRRPGYFRGHPTRRAVAHDQGLAPSTAGSTCTSSSTAAPARSPAGGWICGPAPPEPSAASSTPEVFMAYAPSSSPLAPTTARSSPPATSANTYPLVGSRTAAAATATPRARRSSSPGSANSRSAAPGAPSGKPSTRRERRSPTTSTPTTADPTPGSATAPPPRSPPPGTATPRHY